MIGVSTSCGACKFLRRKCTSECVFAPYYSYDEAVAHFGAVHKIFGASNVSRLLHHLPEPYRGEAALTISFEAVARMRDPVHGCVAYIYALQQEVANLQEEIEVVGNQMANNLSLGVATNDILVASQSTNNSHINNNNDIMINNNDSSLTWSSQQDQIVDKIMVDVVPVDEYWISSSSSSRSSNSVVVPETLDLDENGSCSSQMMMMMNNLPDYSSCLWQGHHLFGVTTTTTTDTTGTGPHLLNQDTFDYSSLLASLPDITT